MGKTYNGEFKSDVALAALIGELTVAEISRRYNVPESVVRRWRQEVYYVIFCLKNLDNLKNTTRILRIFHLLQ